MLMLDSEISAGGKPVCLPCSPGGDNAGKVLEGDAAAVGKELLFVAERVLLLGSGLYIAGFRGDRLIRGTAATVLAMEAFVFGYVLVQRARSR